MAEEEKPIVPEEMPPAEEVEEQPAKKPEHSQGSRLERFKSWYAGHKKWTVPASILMVIIVLAGIPFTRYTFASAVHKRNLEVQVLDSTTGTPVSGATVSIGSISAQTAASGAAVLNNVGLGNQKVTVSKKYYNTKTQTVMSPIFKQKTVPKIRLAATGRQVKITVSNLISKKVLADVNISVAGISAKTDQTGSATIVLPIGVSEQKAKLSLSGFNDTEATIKVSNDKIQDNSVSLTPSGKVYFLSKLSGKIDVVKTNLDGSNRQTVLPGTGNEQDTGTVLLASRDWKYLALLSRRAGSSSSLYLINTGDDSLTTMDEGDADFSLDGWVGSNFVYTVTRNGTQIWQPNRQAVKSYNAETKKAVVLDQTTASGSGSFDYISQLVGGVYAYDDQVFYILNWTASYGGASAADLPNKQATFNSVKPDGSAKKAIKSFGLASGTTALDVSLEERVESPSQIDLKFSDGSKDNFYAYANGQVKQQPGQTADSFYSASFPTYLESPSGNETFWADARDGKNTLFTGDGEGQNAKQIATLSDYNAYGWYTDNYLLVSKNSSELYIMPKGGSQNPVKISDYHKPQLTYPGYGGGYGGI